MTPETIVSLFIADFPPPDARTAGDTSGQMIAWVIRNWDSLNREELMLFLGASELLAGFEIEKAWLGTSVVTDHANKKAADIVPSPPSTGGDIALPAVQGSVSRLKWHESFPWADTRQPRVPIVASNPIV